MSQSGPKSEKGGESFSPHPFEYCQQLLFSYLINVCQCQEALFIFSLLVSGPSFFIHLCAHPFRIFRLKMAEFDEIDLEER